MQGKQEGRRCCWEGRLSARWACLVQSSLGGSLCTCCAVQPFLSKLHGERGSHVSVPRRGLWTRFQEGMVGMRLLKQGIRLQGWAHLFQLAKCRNPEKNLCVHICCGSCWGLDVVVPVSRRSVGEMEIPREGKDLTAC